MQPELERAVAALQDPTRRSILLGFYADPGPRTVDEVAAAAGVHRTVAFGHLERLRALGYLGAGSRRGLRGKPARLYSLKSGPLELTYPPRRYGVLASLLGESVARMGRPGREAARAAGYAFGAAQARPRRGRNGVERALKQVARLGGEYEVNGHRILASTCIFQEACHDSVACDVHAGILEGVLNASGVDAGIQPIGPEGSGCAYRLEVR